MITLQALNNNQTDQALFARELTDKRIHTVLGILNCTLYGLLKDRKAVKRNSDNQLILSGYRVDSIVRDAELRNNVHKQQPVEGFVSYLNDQWVKYGYGCSSRKTVRDALDQLEALGIFKLGVTKKGKRKQLVILEIDVISAIRLAEVLENELCARYPDKALDELLPPHKAYLLVLLYNKIFRHFGWYYRRHEGRDDMGNYGEILLVTFYGIDTSELSEDNDYLAGVELTTRESCGYSVDELPY